MERNITIWLTPQSGLNSRAAVVNSLPYFVKNCWRTSINSWTSAHLGDANITLDIASCRSTGQALYQTQKLHSANHCQTVL